MNNAPQFTDETKIILKQRLRLASVLMALLKQTYLPFFYFYAPDVFIPVLYFDGGLVMVCAITFFCVNIESISPVLLAQLMIASGAFLHISALIVTGGSRSPFFPILLMYILGTAALAPWRVRYSVMSFIMVFVLYFVSILALDMAIDKIIFTTNLMFMLEASIFGVVGIYLWEQLRIREFARRLAAYEERETLCRCLHDGLSSDLYSVFLISSMSEGKVFQKETALRDFGVIREITRKNLDHIRDFLFSADKEGVTLASLADRMHDFGSGICRNSGLVFAFHKNIQEHGLIQLPSAHLFNCYLIYKEAVVNVAKHAQARAITVALTCSKSMLSLTVQDDGQGFEVDDAPARGKSCNGLQNMRTRANTMNGSLFIESNANAGTRVTISVPLRKESADSSAFS